MARYERRGIKSPKLRSMHNNTGTDRGYGRQIPIPYYHKKFTDLILDPWDGDGRLAHGPVQKVDEVV